jgi:uncharacterized protein (DUF2252 family)
MAKKSKKEKAKNKGGKKERKAAKREEIVLDDRFAPDLPKEIPPRMAERFAAGKEVREAVPVSDHAGWTAPADRPDPVAILQQQAETRVPELVPIRYGRMLVSPFTFYRGGAAIMAWDLSRTATTDLRAQVCGDAHLLNFGMYAAPDRRMVFDINDFDETLPASFEWDLKRLVASMVIAARDNGFTPDQARAAGKAAAAGYQVNINLLAQMKFLDVWYARLNVDDLLKIVEQNNDEKVAGRVKKTVEKAHTKTNLGALERYAEETPDGWQIKSDPPVIERLPLEQLPMAKAVIDQGWEAYISTLGVAQKALVDRYRMVDFARKVVGVGSVGTRAFMLLTMGDRDDDPLFLQMKEAQASVLEPYAGASAYPQHGQRVVEGQRLMQSASDSFLGWMTNPTGLRDQFYIRQLRDMKGSMKVEKMNPDRLAGYGVLCAAALARGHARTGDPAKIAGYVGTGDEFAEALAQFGVDYADQNELDYQQLVEAAADGRVTVESGV